MTNYNKWDIILVPFPFTNLKQTKKRPALIVSPEEYNTQSDIVIAFITSNLNLEYRFGDYKIKKWSESNLLKPSIIRMKFATINKSIVIRKLGKLVKKDRTEFGELLKKFF